MTVANDGSGYWYGWHSNGGANNEKVNEWLKAGSSVDSYKGFAIGRSIFWDSLKGWHEGNKLREEAVEEISNSYLGFISVYQNGS